MEESVFDRIANLEIQIKELEENEVVVLYFNLVNKYNTYYSNNTDCYEAIMLEKLIGKLRSFEEVQAFYDCTSKLNDLRSHVIFDEDNEDYEFIDMSARRGMIIKYF